MYNFKENESLYATIVDTVTPTTSTEGVVGQFYIDQSTDPASLYLCTKVETVDSTTTYTWTKQGGKQLYQHRVVLKTSQTTEVYVFFINENSNEYDTLLKLYNEIPNIKPIVTGYISELDKYGLPQFIRQWNNQVQIYCKIELRQTITIDDNEKVIISGYTNEGIYPSRITDTVVAL